LRGQHVTIPRRSEKIEIYQKQKSVSMGLLRPVEI